MTLVAKNLVRGHIGRAWMAIRDMDVAAEVIGIRPLYAKLTAFAVSSFYAASRAPCGGFSTSALGNPWHSISICRSTCCS